MSDPTPDFHALTASDDLRFVKHNPTDFDSFRRFQEELDERFSKTEEDRGKRERKANLAKWSEMVGTRWAGATLKTIENEAVQDVVRLIKEHRKTSFWITGESGSGKSYLAYAIIRSYIGFGWTTPSQVERISEEVLLGMASTGFEGMARFNKLLAPKNKIYLFDGVGSKHTYTDREKQLWEQLIDHIYTNSLVAIFTSNKPAEDFGCHLSDSGNSKLEHLVRDREVVSLSTHTSGKKEKPAASKSPKDKGLQFGADGALL